LQSTRRDRENEPRVLTALPMRRKILLRRPKSSGTSPNFLITLADVQRYRRIVAVIVAVTVWQKG
jgi:hypothetical protein